MKVYVPAALSLSWQSVRFSLPDTMADDAIAAATEPQVYSRKVRFYPTAKQRELLLRCADANRYMFNAANAYIRGRVATTNFVRLSQLRQQVQATGTCVHVFKAGKCKGRRCQDVVADGQEFFWAKHSAAAGKKTTTDGGADAEPVDADVVERGRLGISYGGFLNFFHVRDSVMLPDRDVGDDHPLAWLKAVPYDTRQLAIKECITAWKSALTNKSRGNVRRFTVKFKCKKNMRQIFHVDKHAFNPASQIIFKRRSAGGKLRVRKRDASKVLEGGGVTGDFVVQLVRPGRWFLCLPKVRNVQSSMTTNASTFTNPVHHSVFLDPGVRTFQTMYSPDGLVGKLGDRYWKVLEPLAAKIDLLQTRKATVYSRHRRRMHRRIRTLWHKIRCRVDDLHAKACHFLCAMFQFIFIPAFDAARMSERPGRKISCETTRQMLGLAHGRFRARLITFARTKQRTVVIVSEAYTTKTCDVCGHEHPNVGAAAVFKCPQCGHQDTDVHAARNTLTLEALRRKEATA
jgi:transposase